MPRPSAIVSIAGFAAALAGCATQDVVFVTKTSIGIDVDAQSASVAYDRNEGYLAPRYPNRQAVPVFASVATDGKLLDRNVKQVYATGNAARIVSGAQQQQPGPAAGAQQAIFRHTGLDAAAVAEPRPRDVPAAAHADAAAAAKKTMFFGTGSVLGFKLGFGASSAVDAFTFGFKRKEVSIIPHDENDGELPSVMASLDTGTEAAAANGSRFNVKQFFATGTAAEALANNDDIKKQFQNEAADRLAQYREDERHQRDDALTSLACLSQLDDEQARKVWQNVQALSLFPKEGVDDLLAATTVPAARAVYTREIAITDPTSRTITGLMKGHRVFVCQLPKQV
jgi:hypothetical protein